MAVAESIVKLLSSKQVGARLGVGAARVRALRREGRLPGIRTALGNLHPLSAVEALERERQHRTSVAEVDGYKHEDQVGELSAPATEAEPLEHPKGD